MTAEVMQPKPDVDLTSRQLDVLELAVRGLSVKQIAFRLQISSRTVEDHFARMRERSGTSSIGELVYWATVAGVVRPDGIRRSTISDETPDDIALDRIAKVV